MAKFGRFKLLSSEVGVVTTRKKSAELHNRGWKNGGKIKEIGKIKTVDITGKWEVI